MNEQNPTSTKFWEESLPQPVLPEEEIKPPEGKMSPVPQAVISPAKLKFPVKVLVIFFFSFVLVGLVTAVLFFARTTFRKEPSATPTPSPIRNIFVNLIFPRRISSAHIVAPPSGQLADLTTNWAIFESDNLPFSFKYPAEWLVKIVGEANLQVILSYSVDGTGAEAEALFSIIVNPLENSSLENFLTGRYNFSQNAASKIEIGPSGGWRFRLSDQPKIIAAIVVDDSVYQLVGETKKVTTFEVFEPVFILIQNSFII